MVWLGILLLAIAWISYKASPKDRQRVLRWLVDAIERAYDIVATNREQCAPFHQQLRETTSRPVVTPIVLALSAVVFVLMLFGSGSFADPETLVGWGASFGPRTTNGEWWRLLTTLFVHRGLIHALVNLAALAQIGSVLERLVGRLAVGAVFVASGLLAGVVSVATTALTVHAGASGAIAALYGLLLVWSLRGLFMPSATKLPLVVVKSLAPAAALFVLYTIAASGFEIAGEVTGFVAGCVFGLAWTIATTDMYPTPRRLGIASGAVVVLAVAAAVPLRGMTDVRSEIARLVAVENRTTGAYNDAVDRFRKGRLTAEGLAELIEKTILPDLEAAHSRVKTLSRVPSEQQPLVESAEEYLRLRNESWHLRSEGLRKVNVQTARQVRKTQWESDDSWRARVEAQHKASTMTLGRAETAERASLEALDRIKPAVETSGR